MALVLRIMLEDIQEVIMDITHLMEITHIEAVIQHHPHIIDNTTHQ